MNNPSKRGGLREPVGGRPPKPIEEKYKGIYVKLPPRILEWIAANIDNRNGFIVEAIEEKIARW